MSEQSLHVFITGLPGTGKTHLTKFFKEKGENALDTDDLHGLGHWVDKFGKVQKSNDFKLLEFPGPKWLWDGEKLKQLLSQNPKLYLSGASDNMWDVVDLFDKKYYLYADKSLISARLLSEKRNHDFGRDKGQMEQILNGIRVNADKARKAGFEFVDASLSPQQIFDKICNKTLSKKVSKVV